MNVTVENLAPCKKLVRIEVDAPQVDEAFKEVTKGFQREAAFPGFRPGKAPVDMVVRKYEKDIEQEVKRKLISDSYKKAVEEKKIDVLGNPDIEEIQFGRGQALQYAATVETEPEFQLPEYKGLPAKREARTVTDADVERALDALRQQRAKFDKVERPVQNGDIAVINYQGTCEGKPIAEVAPDAPSLAEQKAFWVDVPSQGFLPGFSEQLLGAKTGEKRTVNVDFPAGFPTAPLAGKRGVYEVEIVEVREKVLPPVDEELAKAYGAENLEKLKEGVRRDLENELKFSQERSVRNQLIRGLLDRVQFELPESAVARETKNVVYDIVNENAKRGISRDIIEKEKDQIYTAAAQGARERVKVAFLLQKIAEQEKIGVTNEEISRRIVSMAGMYQMPPDKFAKDLQKRNGLIEVYDQLMNEKVLELIEQNAKIEEVAPAPEKP